MIVASIVATIFSSRSFTENASPRTTLRVRPALDGSARDESLARCGREEVHLVLRRENRRVAWHERERRVAAGAVDNRGDDSACR
jgi:hypothetical protein